MSYDTNYVGNEADDDMYKENILDHYKHPHNKGEIKDCTYRHTEYNPLCGDKLEVFIKTDDKGMISDIKFEGKGCAISQASISMLTDELKGKDLDYIKTLKKEDIFKMLGITVGLTRLKCALLSLKTVTKAIEK